MKKILLYIFFAATLTCTVNAQERNTVDSTLTVIENLYTSAEFVSAELEARRLLEHEGISDSAKVQIEKWIAFSLIAQEKPLPARDRFIALLSINPGFELDRILTSPKILSVFNDAKSLFLRQVKSQTDSVQAAAAFEERSISFRALLFPGWEQIHQGRSGRGVILLGAGIATLGAGLTCEFLRSNARTDYLNARSASEISSTYSTYNTYRKAEIYSFITFALVYVISEIDAVTYLNSGTTTLESSYSPHFGPMVTISTQF
ncbi:MAG: hypothetical protein WCT99_09355 [Bacteroidota bacterium]